MKLAKRTILLILTSFLFILPNSNSSELNDIYLQKMAYENNIRERISKGISSILGPKEYIVNVQIDMKDVEVVKKEKEEAEGLKAEEKRKKQKEILKAEQKEDEKELNQSANKPQEGTPSAEKNKENIKTDSPNIVGAENYNNGEDVFFIDKFDFSTAVQINPIQNLANSNSTGMTAPIVVNTAKSAPQVLTVNTEKEISLSMSDLITGIKVELLIDKSVTALRYKMVEDIIKRINIPVINMIPEVTYSKVSIIPPDEALQKKNIEAAKAQKELAEAKVAIQKAKQESNPLIKWLKDLKLPIAVILATLIIVAVGFMMLTKLMAFGTTLIRAMDDIFSRSPSEQAKDFAATGEGGEGYGSGNMSMTGGSLSLDDDVPLVGFDRFLSLLKATPTEALTLIRRWISSETEGASQALTIVIKKSSTDDLLYIFDNLSIKDRAQWKKVLRTEMNREDMRIGDIFMESQIMDDIILPPPTLDAESKKILAKITPQECAELIQKDFEIGCILLNILPIDFIVNTFEYLDPHTTSVLSDYGIHYTDGLLNEKKGELQDLLMELKENKKWQFVPYIEKIVAMIPIVGLAKETVLFDSLYRNGQLDFLREAARKYYPGELIFNLHPNTIRKILMKFPRKHRIEFLTSLDPETREYYLSVFGTKDDKMRSFVEADIDLIISNEVIYDKLQKNSDKIGKFFIQFLRQEISRDEEIQQEAEIVIEGWINQKTETVPNHEILKEAA